MRWSFQIARISGIDVKIHFTFFLLLAWYGWIFWEQGGAPAAAQGILFILLLFLCVLLHEFGHAFAARAYGIRTPDITLLPIGGVARLERMPEHPWQELVVAVAGPAVNVVIGIVLFLVLQAKVQLTNLMDFEESGLLQNLMWVNFFLVAFNAIPAFPMDGGRVLRSLLAMKFNYVTATTFAARTGQVIAGLFVVAGFLGSPMLIFIAMFVFLGAQQELAYAKFRAHVAWRRVSDIMQSHFAALPADANCGAALQLVRFSPQPVFPVLDSQLRAVGALTLEDLRMSVEPWRTVGEMAGPIRRVPTSQSLDVFLREVSPGEFAVVENPSGQVVGIVRHPGGG